MGTDLDLSWPELVRRLQADRLAAADSLPQRDEPAWQEANRRVKQAAQVVALQFGLSAADAEDLAQNLMLAFQTSDLLARLAESASLRSYLLTVLRNRAKDLMRRKQREQELAQEEKIPASAGTAERLEDVKESLREGLRRLPREDQELLRMRFWDGLSIAEIARRRREPYSRVAVRLFRLTKRLGRRLG